MANTSTSSSPPPYFSSPPDVWIPIPNTSYRLPLTWEHTRAIQRLAKFFAGLYYRTQHSDEKAGLDKYKSWMVTLFQMNASIHEELVLRNDSEEICQFLTFDEDEDDSLEELEEANALITPIMNYIRDCKGIHPEKISS